MNNNNKNNPKEIKKTNVLKYKRVVLGRKAWVKDYHWGTQFKTLLNVAKDSSDYRFLSNQSSSQSHYSNEKAWQKLRNTNPGCS